MRHPKALYLLFATEMWERLSYYGMRALLVLYLTDQLRGGLGFSDGQALRLYGFYTLGVYVTPLLGGFLADRYLGQRRAVMAGATLMMLGHFLMAVHGLGSFFGALALLILGNGLFKPNISSMVGGLYEENDPRREAGFTFFYMGINTGALLAPLVVGTLGERMGWHWGFGAAGVGMTLGLILFSTLGPKLLGDVGLSRTASEKRTDTEQSLSREEWQRLAVIAVITLFGVLFWAAFEQAGGLVNLFTQRSVDRHVGGFEIPVTWFQGAEPACVVALGPLFAALWTRLSRRPGGGPSTPVKVASGLLWMALGVVPLIVAAMLARAGAVSLLWILGYYLLSTIGELLLSPVSMSAVTRLAPPRYVSRMMGVFLISLGLGSYLAGHLGSLATHLGMVGLYCGLLAALVLSGVLLLGLSPLLRKWSHGVT
jgi:POT family proton-dependent oligopeptide transporter